MGNSTKHQLQKIGPLSFAMACLIVWLHSTPEGPSLPAIAQVTSVTNALGHCAVPFFFFVSGYLFFLNYGPQSAKGKLLRRVRSLLVPYIVWSCLACVVWLVVGHLLGWNYVEECARFDGVGGFIKLFLTSDHLSVLWFVRNLMVYALLSPVFYLLLKHKWGGLAAIAVCAGISFAIEMTYYHLAYWLQVYLLGCWMGIHKKPFMAADAVSPWQLGIVVLWAVLFCLSLTTSTRFWSLFRLATPVAVVTVYDLLNRHLHCKQHAFYKYAFLLYALHWIPLFVGQEFLRTHFEPEMACLLASYCLPPLVVVVCVGLSRFLDVGCHGVYRLLSGGR